MQKLEQFKKQLSKNNLQKRAQEKQKEKEQIETFEKNGGINCDETRDQYLSIKFMNFYISQKIQYLDFHNKKNNKQKNDIDFFNSMKNCYIIIRKTNEGKVIFRKKSFVELHEHLEKEVQEKNDYIKKHFDNFREQCNVFKELKIGESTFYLQKYEEMKDLCDFKTIQKDLDLTFF